MSGNIDLTINVWQEVFKDYEYGDVNAALLKVIRANKTTWAPSPGMIVDKIVVKEKYTQQQLEQFKANKK